MGMKVLIEIDEKRLRELVCGDLANKLGDLGIKPDDIRIEVKSKQNYRAEWESASFRATYEKVTP